MLSITTNNSHKEQFCYCELMNMIFVTGLVARSMITYKKSLYFNKMKKINIIAILFAVCFLMCSCGKAPRVFKLVHDIEHATSGESSIPQFPQNIKLGQSPTSVQNIMEPAYGASNPYYMNDRLYSFRYEGTFHFDGYSYDQELMFFNEDGFLKGIRFTKKLQDQYQSRQLGQQLWNHYNEMYNLAELQYDGGVASTTTTMIKTEEYGNIEFKLYVYAAEVFVQFTLS